MNKYRLLRLFCLFTSAVVVCLLLMSLLKLLENSLIFFPWKYPAGEWQPVGLKFEDAWFQAADGTKLHGWYVPHEKPCATILFCHGNAGNVTHRVEILEKLHDDVNASVLVFDYRGYGRSQGKPFEAGVLADARAARTWLAKRENIAESDIVLMGESLGGAVAVDLAANDGAIGLVLVSTFSNLPDVAAFLHPILPVRWLMRTKFDSAAIISKYKGPLLQLHGEADTIVPLDFAKILFDTANEPKKLLVIKQHNHNDSLPHKFYSELRSFCLSLRKS